MLFIAIKRFDRSYLGSTQIETVSVLYQTNGLFDLDEIDNFVHQLELKDKDVRVLCFSDQSYEKGKRPTTIFYNKRTWYQSTSQERGCRRF